MSQQKIKLKEIISLINPKKICLSSKNHDYFFGFSSIKSSKKGDITFCSSINSKGKKLIDSSNASLIICSEKFSNYKFFTNASLIFVQNPRFSFIQCLKKFQTFKKKIGIHPTAIVESKKIGKNCYIGPFTYISKDTEIQNNTIINGNTMIYGKTMIGKNVIIDSGVVMGTNGFGFERKKNSELDFFPHIGGIIIEDDVEIGANTCIDSGTLENTVIGKGTKIDNLVHIGHNVQIGTNCMIVAKALLGGSCTIGDSVHIAMSVTIRDGLSMGSNSIIGMGSVVTKNVLKNSTVYGNPAKIIKKN